MPPIRSGRGEGGGGGGLSPGAVFCIVCGMLLAKGVHYVLPKMTGMSSTVAGLCAVGVITVFFVLGVWLHVRR